MALTAKQKRSLDLLKKSFDTMSTNYITKWTEYERMYNSEHTQEFLDVAKEQERNAIFIPLTYSTVNIADSIFTTAFFGAGNPIEILKVGDSDAQKKSEIIAACDYHYERTKPYNELSKAFLSASIYGLGSVKSYWDEVKEQPYTEMIPVTEVCFDTDAISRQDNKYIGYKFQQTLQEIEEKLESDFYTIEDPTDKQNILGDVDTNPYKRKLIKEIYEKTKDGYIVKTFCEDVCLRETKFKRCPIKYGYLLNKLPSVDSAIRKNEVAAVGDSLVRVIKPLNEELNIKRNQRMDLIEKHINPDVYIPEECGVDEDDMQKNGGVKTCDTTKGILFAPITGASEFTNDVMMLKNDIEDASSVNGIMRGATNSSDRRSSSALATINANSSPRLEGMIKLICETLFEEWARDFVRQIYINTPSELIAELTETPLEELAIEPVGMRKELDIDLKINFGASINKQAKINDLISIVQMVGSNQNIPPELRGLLIEIIKLTLGENTDAEAILGLSQERTDAAAQTGDAEQEQQLSDAANERGGGDGTAEASSQNESNPLPVEVDRLRNNEI